MINQAIKYKEWKCDLYRSPKRIGDGQAPLETIYLTANSLAHAKELIAAYWPDANPTRIQIFHYRTIIIHKESLERIPK